ncbi:hypothetical protein PPSIR1_36682 [Plesiocystis pacifica SIR-1]|uniref:Uncharacterized protein n=1 Tax=Plesiocystis pacifica SIR-1 TaxID=391625 RepID=A6G1P1_9BACT|nr:hypothetical protein PPSIR1_36682 [Plesiocystis pacifica SIR-1]
MVYIILDILDFTSAIFESLMLILFFEIL